MNEHQYAVIMAGGIGSRFWPMSRQNFPKQFLDILNTGQTLVQATFQRLDGFYSPGKYLCRHFQRIHAYRARAVAA